MATQAHRPALGTVPLQQVGIRRSWEKWLALALLPLDGLAIGVGFALAFYMRFQSSIPWLFETDAPLAAPLYRTLVIFLTPVWLGIFALFRLYDPKALWSGTQEYSNVVNAATMGMMVLVFAGFLAPTLVMARGWVLLAWIMVIVAVGLGRFLFRRMVYGLRAQGHFSHRAVIVGANPEGAAIAEQLASQRHTGLQIIGFLDDERPAFTEVTKGARVLGPSGALEEMVLNGQVDEVIVASTAVSRERLLEIFRTFGMSQRVGLRLSSGLFELMTTGVRVREIGAVPLLSIDRVRLTGANAVLKGILDYVVSTAALVVLSPVLFAIAIAIKLDSHGPVIHRRKVMGLGGHSFYAFKFRTMVVNADELLRRNHELRACYDKNCKIKDDPRITRVGALLRRLSLDELPQLLNVLRGEMSLVGPRMITEEEHERYGKWGTNLLTVKPGITGLWQVSGRSDLSYDERVQLDMYYVRNYSIWLDLRLLFLTVPAMVSRKGAY